MKKESWTNKAWAIIIALLITAIVVVAGVFIIKVDYYMFKRSHPTAGWLEYLWER